MNEVKDKLNVAIKGLAFFLVLITFVSCKNEKKIENKNKNGIVVESYSVDKKHPDIKVGEYKRYYDDGKLMESKNYKKGKLSGERRMYDANGNLLQTENYVDDRMEGAYKQYFADGSPQEEGYFKDNMKSGLWKYYNEAPLKGLKSEMTYKENIINGPAKEYYPNGKLNAEGNKVDLGNDIDVFDGEVKVYDSTGNYEKTLLYSKGRQMSKVEAK